MSSRGRGRGRGGGRSRGASRGRGTSRVEEGEEDVVDIKQDWVLTGEQAVLHPDQDQDQGHLLAKVLLIQHHLL